MSIEQAELRAIVVKACAESISTATYRSSRCVISEPYFIKWAGPELHRHADTQKYVYDQAVQDPNAPRVPKVYDCFDHDTYTYLVMEFIQTLPVQDATRFPQQTADAIEWLRRLPAPPDAKIGSLGGGRARHRLFQLWKAPLLFSNNEALEIYLNRSLERIPRAHRPNSIKIRDEPLVFTQSDMHEDNFILDHTGKICLVDFEAVCLLPESFAVYTVKMSGKPFVKEVAKYLSWHSDNLTSMQRAAGILVMCADPKLGLDENGNKRSDRRS